MLPPALHRRSHQPHTQPSPVHALPIEVLSYIFEQLIGTNDSTYQMQWYRECLRQAIILSSVSAHFRHVALATPELWKRIPLFITNRKRISEASSLLQHCIALTASVNISLYDGLREPGALSVIEILFTSDTTRRIKAFELCRLGALNVWVEKLGDSSFPMLDNLYIYLMSFEIMHDLPMSRPFIMPPSMRFLNVKDIPPHVFVSFLYQCPNLVKCIAAFDPFVFDNLDDRAQFNTPLTLTHLKRLSSGTIPFLTPPSSTQNLRLPSLEFLQLNYSPKDESIGDLVLCRNTSTTLTTLIINLRCFTFDHDNLYRLFKLPFITLRKVEVWCSYSEPFLSAIHALGLVDGEYSDSEARYLPALRSILLRHRDHVFPDSLIDALKKWRIGSAFYFHIQLDSCGLYYDLWSPELQEELRSIVGRRRIEVTWGSHKLLRLCV